jgi:two-component system, OmpR family, phosphate regulon sensor histidine kinase PhoR
VLLFDMVKSKKFFIYKIIAVVSIIILCLVQVIQVKNLYDLENEKYNLNERGNIKMEYEKSIVNDLLYPGAIKIFDKKIILKIDLLDSLSKHDTVQFKKVSTQICNDLFLKLSEKSNIDSLLSQIKIKYQINQNLEYALIIDNIDIAKRSNQYVNIYTNDFRSLKTIKKISGNLMDLNSQNLVTSIIVSESKPHTIKMACRLYCDSENRTKAIILKILPFLLLTIGSIIAVSLLFFLTYLNWMKQSKLSDLKSDFINTITHEFQTPLTTIIIANKTIHQTYDAIKKSELLSLTEVIDRQTDRLNALVKQVVNSNENTTSSLNLKNQAISPIINDIVRDFQLSIKDNSIELKYNNLSYDEYAVFDKLHFSSILLNILSNAIKYNNQLIKVVSITTYNDKDNLLVMSIKDNGIGMSATVRKNIFNKFYRFTTGKIDNIPGLGLGLYYTKQCLDAHLWRYEVISELNTGTEFKIFIPISKTTL